MHIFVIVIAVVLVGFGAFTQIQKKEISGKESVLGDTPTPQQTDTTTPSATETPVISSTPTRTPTQTPRSPTPSTTQKQSGSGDATAISSFIYPGANTSYRDTSAVNLESNDNSDTITDWYKAKIESLGYNAKSFVKTKTNGNVKNSLVGADGKTEIRVEITKATGSNTTHIFITMKTT